MNDFFFLIPIALGLGVVGLAAFMWSLRSGQYDDLQGAAARILLDESDHPIVNTAHAHVSEKERDQTDRTKVEY
jgi:cbb3-type cytochrome oxidase maturation protein